MCKCKKKREAKKALEAAGSVVTVNVDVTKIVKYIAFAGIVIVGIIFGTGAYVKQLEHEKKSEED